MKKPLFRGANTAMVTPFTWDNKINFSLLGDLIERQIQSGVSALTICGTTGEKSTLDDKEHKDCLLYAIDKAAGRVPILAGTGSNDTRYCLQMSRFAASHGADGLLLVTPYYNKTTQPGLIRHFLTIADAVDKPIVLYSVPSRTGMGISAETYKVLSEHPNINGTKEASGDLELITEVRRICGDELNIWSGEDSLIVPILSLGGQGVISVLSNVMPREVSAMCSLWFEGKTSESAALAVRTFDLAKALFLETNPIPVKAALNLMGFDVGEARMPLTNMTDANLAKLKAVMQKHGLIS
ncbi:MAG: 4-hydroxy-tetrahydrodipicolinate synthase [Clostridia bacterium]|nr:4-hydroxy-tetrahydrodipicolinate synthase [Clostridia bacterium]